MKDTCLPLSSDCLIASKESSSIGTLGSNPQASNHLLVICRVLDCISCRMNLADEISEGVSSERPANSWPGANTTTSSSSQRDWLCRLGI
ncbi:hypothetical protein D3C73_1365320 [compost metagenome]